MIDEVFNPAGVEPVALLPIWNRALMFAESDEVLILILTTDDPDGVRSVELWSVSAFGMHCQSNVIGAALKQKAQGERFKVHKTSTYKSLYILLRQKWRPVM